MTHGERRKRTRLADALEAAGDGLERCALAALNPLFFSLRRRIAFRREGYRESPSAGATPSPSIEQWLSGERARRLVEAYDLEPFRRVLSRGSFALTLLRLDLLDLVVAEAPQLVGAPGGPAPRVLDVGAKNFDSAVALERFFRTRVAPPSLTGVEIDAFRIYRGWHSRADVAHYYLSLLPAVSPAHRYLATDVLAHEERYDVVTWFKPFLTSGPLLRWGLPRRLLRPEVLLAHVADRLERDGRLLVVNQEEHEAEAQENLLARHGGLRWTRLTLEDAAIRIGDAAHAFVVERKA